MESTTEPVHQGQPDTWYSEVEQLARQIPAEDFDRIDAALDKGLPKPERRL